MGQNVISRRVFGASGAESGSRASGRSKPTTFEGRVEKIESHTRTQFVIIALVDGDEKRLKIGVANILDIKKGDVCLFTCVPNTNLADGACAAWRVTKKPEQVISSELSDSPSLSH